MDKDFIGYSNSNDKEHRNLKFTNALTFWADNGSNSGTGTDDLISFKIRIDFDWGNKQTAIIQHVNQSLEAQWDDFGAYRAAGSMITSASFTDFNCSVFVIDRWIIITLVTRLKRYGFGAVQTTKSTKEKVREEVEKRKEKRREG
ncbi:hypothetical protein OCU04_008983 [Sclerotinia nivalis]|uniref:Uncharacterized protein n=1 Tax=Sclerotinia nivalis TaxID=352851 RepID=A0A9X0DH96_9HELO|nr:hypothetical protein OCU04_008983 [Sclerotinia nivalis]